MISDDQWRLVGEAIGAGRYNLLLGAGVSLDSPSGLPGRDCPSAGQLVAELGDVLPNMRRGASLQRLKRAMTPEQVGEHITKRFAGCGAGPTVRAIAGFRWKRIFTLNVDDALERAYDEQRPPVQEIVSYNYDDLFEDARDLSVLPIAHLHGWARQPERGYVFEIAEYARVVAQNNVWSHLLANLIRTEPFIVIGTTLEEPDFATFLAYRADAKPRSDALPSLLVEPYPDDTTHVDCNEYGLTLVQTDALTFLNEVQTRFPDRPSVAMTIEANLGDLSHLAVEPATLAQFNADFERIPTTADEKDGGYNFAYGHQATWSDLLNGRDLDRGETVTIERRITPARKARMVVVAGGPGAGKSTTLRRIGWNLAQAGNSCLWVRAIGRIRVESAIAVLSRLPGRRYVLVDNLADNVREVALLRDRLKDQDVTFVGAERDYRLIHVERVLGTGVLDAIPLPPIGPDLAAGLVAAYGSLGIAPPGKHDRNHFPLADELIAIACCRILNDFEPLTDIVDKSLRHRPEDVDCYVFAALAAHCYRRGIELDVIAGRFPDYKVDIQIDEDGPLPLKLETVENVDLVTPSNEAVSDTILRRFAGQQPGRMLDVFEALAAAIAPRVNRRALGSGTACVRIASRLFDYDEVVKPLLGLAMAGEFYDATKRAWEWNSRYWHQRAQHRLDQASTAEDPVAKREHARIAVQHARFAKRIEPHHQFTLTTIGRTLFGRMRVLNAVTAADLAEALTALSEAISIERSTGRSTVHPFVILFAGLTHAIGMGAVLSPEQRSVVRSHLDRAVETFPRDRDIREHVVRLGRRL